MLYGRHSTSAKMHSLLKHHQAFLSSPSKAPFHYRRSCVFILHVPSRLLNLKAGATETNEEYSRAPNCCWEIAIMQLTGNRSGTQVPSAIFNLTLYLNSNPGSPLPYRRGNNGRVLLFLTALRTGVFPAAPTSSPGLLLQTSQTEALSTFE